MPRTCPQRIGEVLTKRLKEAREGECDYNKPSELISTDRGAVGALLKTVNSCLRATRGS